MPVFVMFMFAVFEFGHAMMVRGVVLSAAKEAARIGSIGDATTQDVRDFISERLGKAFDSSFATVYIKSAAIFDDPNAGSESVDVSDLPDIELADAKSREPFIVHIRVPYDATSLLPPFWTGGLEITGDSVVRHE